MRKSGPHGKGCRDGDILEILFRMIRSLQRRKEGGIPGRGNDRSKAQRKERDGMENSMEVPGHISGKKQKL